jgi:integrase
MASILKIGTSWRVQIRRKGHQNITETFPTKSAAQKWATRIESEMDSRRYQDERGLEGMTLGKLIDRYNEEIGLEKQFGKNKVAVLAALKAKLGDLKLSEITDDRLTKHVRGRRAEGAGGVTISIELTYLGGVFKVAKQLWKIPLSTEPIAGARANMKHLGISTKSVERERRPTTEEINALCAYFDAHSALPMRDLIQFAVQTAMRLGEITRLRWDDLNEKDRTIIIRDRKHPTQKKGNDQEVPLLGDAFDIAKRQAKTSERIFPINEKTVSSIFPRACRYAGIEDLHFHDLRHEGVSRLFEQGYAIEQVSLISGHRDWKMLARYTQIRAKDLHRPATQGSNT